MSRFVFIGNRACLFCCFLLLAVLFSCQQADSGQGAGDKPPNFVVIMADDCTFRDLEVYGGPASTPNLMGLAEEGMIFNRCFQATAMCAPTRQNLLTGLYPVRNGGYANHTYSHDTIQSVVHYLRARGYRTALTGKRHIGPPEVYPFEYSEDGTDPDLSFIEQFFRSNKDGNTPFCLFAMCSSPHVPWTFGNTENYPVEELSLPPYLIDTRATRRAYARYLAEVTYFDRQVGQILGLLEEQEMERNTLVMVLSEHGNLFPFEKWTCYDAGLRSAMIVRFPGIVNPGVRTNAMVEYVDVVPTLMDFAGKAPDQALDGKSFRKVLTGEKDHHKEYVFGIQTTLGVNEASQAFGIRSVRTDSFKYIRNLFPENRFENALLMEPEEWSPRRQDYLWWMQSWRDAAQKEADARDKLQRYQQRPPVELYNVLNDPYEMNNLAGDSAYARTIDHLSTVLDAWMEEQGDEGRATELKIPARM